MKNKETPISIDIEDSLFFFKIGYFLNNLNYNFLIIMMNLTVFN